VTDAFDRLSPAVGFQIANALGFASLRPVQELTIPAVLDGHNCVVLAPTAGGKTEAAFFPLLSRMDREGWKPVSVLYISPIRALLNNQAARLQGYAALIGRSAAVWHGDVTDRNRNAFLREPTDILLTTPESLEVMLMSARIPARRLFAGLQAVVIDEIHAFVNDDRGGHLAAVLERLSRFCGRDVQRIGLSATIGNPETILAWMAGSSKRPGLVVSPPRQPVEPNIVVDFVGSMANAAKVIATLYRGRKRLVFVDSRAGVEALGALLHHLGTETHVLHSSLSAEERRRTEAAFVEGTDCVIVATSSLELGIDIGDLDHVLQVDAPQTVANFVQRMGRTGRRSGTTPNCTFLATDDDALLQAAALVRLYREGFIEPVVPVTQATHLLAHQLMALSKQEHGIPVSDWWAWIGQATPFVDLTEDTRAELVGHMLAQEILVEDAGRLHMGPQGEKLYGGKNFLALYAVFDSADTLDVFWGRRFVGTIESAYVEQQGLEDLMFTLGAKAWKAVHVDWPKGRLMVVPAARGKAPRWRGSPTLLSTRLCEAIRGVLLDDGDDAGWSRRAVERMAAVRDARAQEAEAGRALLPDGDGLAWWTFAGGKVNHLLAKVLEGELGEKVTADNLRVRFKGEAGKSAAAVQDAIEALARDGRPTEADALAVVAEIVRGRVSKFQACVTAEMAARLMVGRVVDVAGARKREAYAPE
jgi:ATP-dependent Lhr-like helicase